MLYLAYGSNLSVARMKQRCPRAKKLRPLYLHDSALVFRGVADVTLKKGAVTPCGLWRITRDCERSLDRFEGVNSRFYMKRYLQVKQDGVVEDCLLYQMRTHRGVMPPTEEYLSVIEKGYRDFGLDLAYLDVALQEAWGNKDVTQMLRERHVSKGRPALARL